MLRRPWWQIAFVAGVLAFCANIALERSHVAVWGDGLTYYAYDQSLFLDGDLDFGNQYPILGVREQRRTASGMVWNPHPVGTAVLDAPFFAVGHAVAVLFHLRGDGFSIPEQVGFVLGSMFWGYLGLVLAVRLIRRLVDDDSANLAALVWLLGSSLPYYLFKEGSYAHACSFFAVTAFLAYDQEVDEARLGSTLALGLLAGLMTTIENQNALYLVVPLWRRWRELVRAPWLVAVAGVGALVGFAPQLIVSSILFGRPFADTYAGLSFEPFRHLASVLFSPFHGLVTWTPIAGPAIGGLVLAAVRDRRTRPYLAAFVLQWLVNGSWFEWWFGAAFGSRKFVSASAILMLGLAYLFSVVRGPRRRALLALIAVLSAWNCVLAVLYATKLISQGRPLF
jgi:hypothetical protein